MAQSQEGVMSKKLYHELEQDPLFLDPSSETGHTVLRMVATLDKKFDSLFANVVFLGDEAPGGRAKC